MPHIFAQVNLPNRNLIAADGAMNTFHFTGIDDVEDMCIAIKVRLEAFYDDVPVGGTNPLKNYLSGELAITSTRVKMYDMADPEPRVPVFDDTLGLSSATPLSSSNLPGEVALCTSYLAAAESGGHPARRRGRLYIGPLCNAVMASSTTTAARPSSTFISDLYRTTKDLAGASTLGARWVVWSRVDQAAHAIVRGYVDNAFDTQRRRGVESTSRSLWEVEIPGP